MLSTVLLTAGLALAQAPKSVDVVPADDVEAVRGTLKLVTDGKQHFIALPADDTYSGPFWWSDDGKEFYRLRSPGGGSSGKGTFDAALWEPRNPSHRSGSSFTLKDGKYTVSCGGRSVELTPVAADEGKKALEAAKFFKSRWRRIPVALARDDNGTYYLVDVGRDEDADHMSPAPRDFRLYVGPRGGVKQVQITNLVADSEGNIFKTKSGDFRFITGKGGPSGEKNEAKWVSGAKTTPLVWVPILDNVPLIYNELGQYVGKKLGTPCDAL